MIGASSRRSRQRTDRPKVAVVTWSVNHNPVGRALVLAELLAPDFDVEIVGFEFPAFGPGVWPPVRHSPIPVRSYAGTELPAQFDLMQAVGRSLKADAVLVSKPRLPGLLVGALAKEAVNRPLVVDVDDCELAFVKAETGIGLRDLDSVTSDDTVLDPYGRVWTQACQPLVRHADAVTVSNMTLQNRFKGTVIPHSRDEHVFDPKRFDRGKVRARFGIDANARVVLFGGTPRRHKGVIELAAAIVELRDPAFVLLLIETPELRELRRDLERLGCPLIGIPPQPFHDMPALLAAADVTAVLQDPSSPISQYQMPAKITDALAMQIPCIVNRVPPLEPLIDAGHLEAVGADGLSATLRRVLDDGTAHRTAIRNRDLFLDHYSHGAVSPTLCSIVRSEMSDPRPLNDGMRELLHVQRRLFGARTMPVVASSVAPSAGDTPEAVRRRGVRAAANGGPYDLVVFWKQNDSGIYGRRSDMLIQHIARSERVANVVQFDAPLGIEALGRMGRSEAVDQSGLVFETTIRRVLGQEHEDGIARYTYLYDDRGDRPDLPTRNEYLDYVAEVFELHGVGQRDVVFWVYPTDAFLPQLIDRFQPHVVVADVVDDNRTWYPAESTTHARLTENYAAVLARSDVVLANCDSVRDSMGRFHEHVELLANACEPPLDAADEVAATARTRPPELAHLNGPVIGYVGNLSARIDVPLIDHIAVTHPEWNIVLIGSAHAGDQILQLRRHPNVSLLGPKRHDDAKRYITAFDVAVIPHVDDEMTQAMNPLKAFVYCSLGVPVVSTPVANLDVLQDMIIWANGPDEFVASIDKVLATGRQPLTEHDRHLLERNSWQRRAARALHLIDSAMKGDI